MDYKKIQNQDEEVFHILEKEVNRKRNTLEMIPSENHTSPAVLSMLSSVFNDKYAEGYPKKRYYGGNEHIDEIEVLCQERAKKLFDVPFVNVQPYSGSPANMAVYFATINPGDKVLGMHLSAGGHLTHGWKVNFSGKYYQSAFYGVSKETHLLDYQEIKEVAENEKPKLIFVGATAYPREVDFSKFKEIADSVGAYLCADISHIAGLVVAGEHQSPVEYVDVVTTTTHKTLRGPRGAMIMVTQSGIDKDNELPEKINKAVFPGLQGGPHMHQIAGVAVCLKEAISDNFKEYGKQVVKNAKTLADELLNNGFNLVTGGTDNHLLLLDLTDKNIKGKEAQNLLEKAGIIVNKNAVPFDENPPANPSGVRMGTPAITTRGLKEDDVRLVAKVITEVLSSNDEIVALNAKKEVENICQKFLV